MHEKNLMELILTICHVCENFNGKECISIGCNTYAKNKASERLRVLNKKITSLFENLSNIPNKCNHSKNALSHTETVFDSNGLIHEYEGDEYTLYEVWFCEKCNNFFVVNFKNGEEVNEM